MTVSASTGVTLGSSGGAEGRVHVCVPRRDNVAVTGGRSKVGQLQSGGGTKESRDRSEWRRRPLGFRSWGRVLEAKRNKSSRRRR
jgi:hypothetical protein